MEPVTEEQAATLLSNFTQDTHKTAQTQDAERAPSELEAVQEGQNCTRGRRRPR